MNLIITRRGRLMAPSAHSFGGLLLFCRLPPAPRRRRRLQLNLATDYNEHANIPPAAGSRCEEAPLVAGPSRQRATPKGPK